MNELFIYFFKVNIGITVLYLLYRLLFYKDTFWISKRIYLLSAIFISFIYPFLDFSSWIESEKTLHNILNSYIELQQINIASENIPKINIEKVFIILYIVVSSVLLIKIVLEFTSVLYLNYKSSKAIYNGVEIRKTHISTTPFSFSRWIFINPENYREEELTKILTHEQAHVKQMHIIDILLSELLVVICWINPFAWLLKREIRNNLEHIADNIVLKTGFDIKDYQYLLLDLSLKSPSISLINKFNVSPLKKRIAMMNRKKTKKTGLIKYVFIIPVLSLLALTSSAQKFLAENMNSNESEATLVYDNNQDKIYDKVEGMPQFPGGVDAMITFLRANIQYPTEAAKNNISGRVVCSFIVDKEGYIKDIKVIKNVDPQLDKEAIRVINMMPRWEPGKQDGKNVNVYFTLPINFSLQ